MKRKLQWAFVGLAFFAAVAFSSCKGDDGKVYLTVTTENDYSGYGGFDTGLGLPANWSTNTKYEVHEGTWVGIYTLAYFSYSSSGNYYYRTNSYGLIGFTSAVGAAYAAAYVTTLGYYESGSITLKAEKGAFLSSGEDRSYVLTLGWYADESTLTYNKVPMASRVIANTDDKIIKEFTSDYDTITLTFNKKPVATSDIKNMHMMKLEGAVPSADVKAILK
jgi:hypothetical protein